MITHEKGLRAGVPVWFDQRKPPVRHQASTGDLSTEVLIIGAGISGALVAEHLTSHGFEVVLVDRREPLTGSTSASTALLQYELDLPLMKLSRMVGVKNAETIWRRSRLALEALAARSRRLGIEANLTRRDALYLSGDERDAKALAPQFHAATAEEVERALDAIGEREHRDAPARAERQHPGLEIFVERVELGVVTTAADADPVGRVHDDQPVIARSTAQRCLLYTSDAADE